jgi:hypothetical protein
MKFLFAGLLCLSAVFCFAQEGSTSTGNPVTQVNTVEELMAYTGSGKTLLVTDKKRGGIFTYAKVPGKGKFAADSGMTFPAYENGYWQRLHDDNTPVHLSWFNAYMDSVTDDSRALKAALKYSSVLIDGHIALKGGFTCPAAKTIECAGNTTINILDSAPVKMDATFHATDYQDIFRGSGHILFGTRSAPYVSACWFGARADCPGAKPGKGTDNTTPIQNAINAAEKVSEVLLPPAPGNMFYRTTATITIRKKNNFFYFSFHGGGTSFGFTPNDRSSNIFADMTQGSAINIQGSRRVYVHNLAFRGNNTCMAARMPSWRRATCSTDSIADVSLFMSPGLKPSYAAITTDAEVNNKAWSADVVLEDLQIDRFCLGIGTSQAGHLAGDRIRVERCQVNFCTYGISVGNAQNRGCHFKNVDMNRVWCGITNTEFGNHSGSMFMVTGGQWCEVYKMFIIQPCYIGQCIISGLYTEGCGCIGSLGHNNENTGAVIFRGCNLCMRDEALHKGNMFLPPYYTATVCGNVTFDGCNFYVMGHQLNMLTETRNSVKGSAITLRGCTVLKVDRIFINGISHIENTYSSPYADGIDFNNTVDAILDDTARRYDAWYNTEMVHPILERQTADHQLVQPEYKVSRVIPQFYTVQATKGYITNVSLAHDTISFTYDEALQPSLFRYVLPGDVLGSTIEGYPATGVNNPAVKVLAIDSNQRAVTAIAYSNKITFEQLGLYTNCFFFTRPLTATVTAGSNIISNVSNIRLLHPGDFITFKGASKVYHISSRDTTNREVTVIGPISESISGQVEIFNQQLTPYTDTSIINAAFRMIDNDIAIDESDHTIVANSSAKDLHITLPPDIRKGHSFFIKKNAAAHSVIIAAQSGTIDGKQNVILKDNYQSVRVLFDGENYITIR